MVVDIINRLTQTTSSVIGRAIVVEIRDDGVVVSSKAQPTKTSVCDLLETSTSEPFVPSIGDEVLVLQGGSSVERGCILGRIRNSLAAQENRLPIQAADNTKTKHVTIVADSTLQLKCGKGSISISEDGTIIIKGSRLLSKAKGVNKIKGASVQVN